MKQPPLHMLPIKVDFDGQRYVPPSDVSGPLVTVEIIMPLHDYQRLLFGDWATLQLQDPKDDDGD